jgi:hypothetical protein
MKYLQKHREETADQPDRLKTFSNQTAHRVSQSAVSLFSISQNPGSIAFVSVD